MRMNKINTLSILSFAATFALAGYSVKKVTGSHPGSTGAPGEMTCSQIGCHFDAQVITNAVNNNTLIFSGQDSSYYPGQVYTLTLQVQGSAAGPTTRFGFELVALKNSDTLNSGQFYITEANRNQIVSYYIDGNLRYSVTHKSEGTPAVSDNFNQWVFNWEAPSENAGKITFYYATNCTNDDGTQNGDRIYLHSYQIKPAADVSIKETKNESALMVNYRKNDKMIQADFETEANLNVSIFLLDINGKELYTNNLYTTSRKSSISIKNNYSPGTYLVTIKANGLQLTKKIMLD